MKRETLKRGAAALGWLLLLLAPAWTVAARANGWEAAPWQLAAVSAWFGALALLVIPARLSIALTYPLALAGLAVVVADLAMHADLLELASVWYTFAPGEVAQSLAPHAWLFAGAAAVVPALLVWISRAGIARPGNRVRMIVLAAGAMLAIALPAPAWRGAWPFAIVGAAAEGALGDTGIALASTADSRASPRTRDNWGARRQREAAPRETYVLVIGESVRSDRIPGCGGRPQVMGPPASAILWCDVLAGASSTHVSVPLLVSRDAPGLGERVPRDGTVLRAFEAAGFDTFWLGVQDRSIAWPDARSQAFERVPRLDRDALLPLLDEALARPGDRKAIVVHAYNAHLAYGDRYDPARAPFRVDRGRMRTGQPAREAMQEWWNDYDNAIDETMRFLAAVTQRVDAAGGEAFVLYTPDHAENMLDDVRGLTAHALKQPTWWDTRVPLVAWANPAWHARHPAEWERLAASKHSALMHMDVAPTWLGAAGIAYDERRALAVNLTARAVPDRVRVTAARAGQTTTEAQLRAEAGLPPRP